MSTLSSRGTLRRDDQQKTDLIESILLGIPIPPIFVAQRTDGVWDVIDGLQRLGTILQFVGVKKDEAGNNQPRPEAVVLGRPPEGADYVRLPPLGAWSWSGPSFLPGTGRGFSVDDDFQAYPLSCESLPKP